MIALKIFILFAVAAFWGSILWNLHKRGGFWAEWPISSELSGRYDNLGFVGIRRFTAP